MSKKKCIFLSAHLPTLNIPVAGQKIAYNNLKNISEKYDVILISFINDIEIKYFDSSMYSMCYKTHFFRISKQDRIKSILLKPYCPVRVSPRYSPEIVALLKKYLQDFSIELFHSEYTAVMSYVDLFPNNVNKEVVEHDIVYQSFERYCQNKKFPIKLFYCLESKKQKKWELEKLHKFNNIIVLNDKDKKLLENEKIENINVIFPKVDDWCFNISRDKIEPFSILFLGAMNRFENQDAILWFVEMMLPNIENKYPNVKLYIVGGNPPDKIKKLATKNIEVTGFVDSLERYFEKSHVAIVPLRYGAGVKIKTLETIASKIPTVATEIGAEGIPTDENLIIADTEVLFSNKIISIFDNYIKEEKF